MGFHFTTLLDCNLAQLVFSSGMTPNDLLVEKESEKGSLGVNKALLIENEKCTIRILFEYARTE